MRIADIATSDGAGAQVLSADIHPKDRTREPLRLWFDASGLDSDLARTAKSMIAAMLPACMYEGEDLHIEGSVAANSLLAAERIQETLLTWNTCGHSYAGRTELCSARATRYSPASLVQVRPCCMNLGICGGSRWNDRRAARASQTIALARLPFMSASASVRCIVSRSAHATPRAARENSHTDRFLW